MRKLWIMLATFVFAGCQFDPHAHLHTTNEPQNEDVVGTYVLDTLDLHAEAGTVCPEIVVELHADGTFVATNIPRWDGDSPGPDFFTTLIGGNGKWQKALLAVLDRVKKDLWGVYLRSSDHKFHPANFTGNKPPSGLIFTLGDPDCGDAVLLKWKQ